MDRLWDAVEERVEEDLRVVTIFRGNEFETRMRADIRAKYTPAEDRDVVDDTVLTQLNLDRTEGAYKTGDLHAIVRVFDEAWILSWAEEFPTKSGVIVSIQRDGSIADMTDVEWCVDYLNDLDLEY